MCVGTGVNRGTPMTSRALTVHTVATAEGFDSLRDEWNELVAASADTVFLTHAWLANWLRFLGGRHTPHVLLARDEQRLVAALPLARRSNGAGIRTMRFMGCGTLTPHHLDLLAVDGFREPALSAFVEQLLSEQRTWDVLDLDKLPEDTPTAAALQAALSAAGMPTTLAVSAVCPYAQLPSTYDEFFSGLSKSARRHTRERIRCIEREHPNAAFGMVRSEEELDRALDALIRLHQQRWEARGYAGSFSDARIIEFHRATTKEALQQGFLRFYTLSEDENVAAAVLCYRMNGSVQAYSCAFEPHWATYRPGMVLGAYAIEHAIAEGATRYDHLEGDEAHKSTWAGHMRQN
ncbi:GNAT family N-acetyltransferase, partial [bacterium]|nr:GNAT family N-acetyltransferase [bacterium]